MEDGKEREGGRKNERMSEREKKFRQKEITGE